MQIFINHTRQVFLYSYFRIAYDYKYKLSFLSISTKLFLKIVFQFSSDVRKFFLHFRRRRKINMKRTVKKEVDLLFYIKSFEIYKQRIGILYNLTMLSWENYWWKWVRFVLSFHHRLKVFYILFDLVLCLRWNAKKNFNVKVNYDMNL